jgi:hypothetical protein
MDKIYDKFMSVDLKKIPKKSKTELKQLLLELVKILKGEKNERNR